MKRAHLVGLLAVTLATMAFVAAGLPGLAQVRGWFYHPVRRGLGEAWPLAVGSLLIWLLVRLSLAAIRAKRSGWAVAALFGVSLIGQLTLIGSDSNGLSSVFRWQYEGHGEIARIAHLRRGRLLETLRNYDSLVARRRLGHFLPSKPPGAYAVYAGVEALGHTLHVDRWLGPLVDAAAADPRIGDERADTAALAFLLFPLATAFVVPMTFALGQLVFERRSVGYAAALLALSSPAVLLIQQHLDNAVYPSLALGSAALASLGARRGVLWWTAAGGLLWGASLYVSFSLLPVAGLALGCVGLVLLRQAHEGRWASRALAVRRFGWHAVVFGAGAVAALAVLVRALSFRLAERLTSALSYHEHWKRGVPTEPWRWWALVEFSLYLSFPFAAAFLWRTVSDAWDLATRRFRPSSLASVGLMSFFLLLAAVAGTNEVARLWLFMVPFVAVTVAAGIDRAARPGRWWAPVVWLAACQAVVVVVLKANQTW